MPSKKKTKKENKKEKKNRNILPIQARPFLVIFLGVFLWSVVVAAIFLSRVITDVFLLEDKNTADPVLEFEIAQMVEGYPIAVMVPYIASKDRVTAALLIGIAKKESDWGKRTPKLDGKECYNYWGYRGKGKDVTRDGYSCFRSPRHAVQVVGRRIATLAVQQGLKTPDRMIVWKCGRSCAGHSAESVKKWISDVDYYFQQLVR